MGVVPGGAVWVDAARRIRFGLSRVDSKVGFQTSSGLALKLSRSENRLSVQKPSSRNDREGLLRPVLH